MKPEKRKKLEVLCDGGILFAALILALILGIGGGGGWIRLGLAAAILCAAAAGIDLILRLTKKKEDSGSFQNSRAKHGASPFAVRELLLLDENNKPLKSWNLSGKTSMIIGKKNKDEEVDVDLGDCEYGALIEPQHALLNFSGECWYLEDVSEENGVRVKKAEDGISYKLSGRPCQVGAGDVIYIANTRLLLT